MDTLTISTIYSDGKYVGWPTIARSPKTGRLFVVFSGDRAGHVCPYGKVMMMTSDDDGATWSDARVIYNSPLDDRDAGVYVTSNGTVLVNWFNSMGQRYYLEKNWQFMEGFGEEELNKWREIYKKIDDDCVNAELGCWLIRSEDNGETFSEKIPTIANSPHGPTELADGRLLYIGKLRDDFNGFAEAYCGAPHSDKIGTAESADDGKTWQLVCEALPVAPGHIAKEYHEYHAIQADDGTIIAQIRSHNGPDNAQRETLQTESTDGGKTWSMTHGLGVPGFPSHLLKLNDGRLLMSYSHRYEPMGNFARTSKDNGKTWSAPFVFGPTATGDMGYPASTQLPDGTILSVWYEQVPGKAQSVIRMARWTLAE